MKGRPKKFWRGFTWKRFGKHLLLFFTLFLIFNILFAWFDPNEKVVDLFSFSNILKWVLQSLFWSFFVTLWSDPAEKEETVE